MAQNVIAERTPEEEIRDKLMKDDWFKNMPKEEQDVFVQAKVSSNEGNNINKKAAFDSEVQEAKNAYKNAKRDKWTQKRILNEHIKYLVDRGEAILDMNPESIIEQSVKGKIYSPEKRREEFKEKSDTQLVDALKAQLDDKNNSIAVDTSLTEYYSMNEWEIKVRFKNIRARRRAKKWSDMMNTQKPEQTVLYLVAKWSLITRKSLLRDPNRVNDKLNKNYTKYIKPDIDALKWGNADDQKLAQQLQDKLVAIKRSYAISRISPLLDLKNSSFN